MLSKRSWFVIGIAAIFLVGIGMAVVASLGARGGEILLSDYPELFETSVLIVVGENASQIELESAVAIAADLEGLAANEPIIKTDAEVSQSDKTDYNLILVGTPNSNILLQEVYDFADAARVTEEDPGKSKGILEILRSLWNEDKVMLLVQGSDEWGVKAGSERLREVQDIYRANVGVEWNGVNAVFSSSIRADKYIFIEFSQGISGAPVMIDYPVAYTFEDTSGVLEGGDFEINESLVMVIGHRLEVEEPGGGVAGGVTPVYASPSTVGIPLPWTIVYVDSDGTIYLRYEDIKVVLRSGEEYQEEFAAVWMGYEVVYRTTIRNHGFQDKSRIRLQVI